MREEQKEVLVVGAGPVGLLTALLLAEAGIEVEIIDREQRTTARSYACALHPRSLALLQQLGLADAVLAHGRRIEKMAFYDGPARRAELDLSALGGPFPFLLVLPQNALENVLEQRLRQKTGVAVRWNERFDAVECEEQGAVATVEELEGTSTGYIIPHWETVVKKRRHVRARFLVGADGPNSLVRQRLGLEHERLAGRASFAAYEFESNPQAEPEVRVVLDDATTNVLWPLPGARCRWTFQLLHGDLPAEFPDKERRAVRFAQTNVDDRIRQAVQKASQKRAPWFSAAVQEILWCTEVAFEPWMLKRFGQGPCWLAGDAAHQTGPVGAQSMNAGLAEADALAEALRRILREKATLDLLENYDGQRRAVWRQLLGLSGRLQPAEPANQWVRQHGDRILPCLPASGDDLAPLARQLDLQWTATSDQTRAR